MLGWLTESLHIKPPGRRAGLLEERIAQVKTLGSSETVRWSQEDDHLTIEPPSNKPSDIAIVFELTLDRR